MESDKHRSMFPKIVKLDSCPSFMLQPDREFTHNISTFSAKAIKKDFELLPDTNQSVTDKNVNTLMDKNSLNQNSYHKCVQCSFKHLIEGRLQRDMRSHSDDPHLSVISA